MYHTQLCMVLLASRKKDKLVDLVEVKLSTSNHTTEATAYCIYRSPQLRHTATVLLQETATTVSLTPNLTDISFLAGN